MEKSYRNGITLITPTGNRQLAIERCEYYIRRQTIQPDQWIIGEDSSFPIIYSAGQEVYNSPFSKNKKKSFTGNLLKCLPNIKYDIVIVIEDDDWYHSTYIERSLQRVKDFDLIGQPYAVYYNVKKQKWRMNRNDNRASFCETVFRSTLIPIVEKACAIRDSAYVDSRLWRTEGIRKRLFADERLVVGLKGLPGRPGIGIGHRPGPSYTLDPDWKKLKELISEEDAQFYINLKKSGTI